MADVRVDESVSPAAHRAALAEALEAGRVDNRFHYVGGLSAARWQALAASHSPAHDDADGLVAYERATEAALRALPDGPVHVVGLACGDGVKERRLLGAMAATGRTGLAATPVDVSVPLVTAASEAMAAVPGVDATHAVAADLLGARDMAALLEPRAPGTRVVTLFGVVSTLGPAPVGVAAGLLSAGDLLMVSANLLPDRPGARDQVMAQYDNPPTREWLGTVLAEIGLGGAGDIAFRWEESPSGPVIVGEVTPPRTVVAEADGVSVGLPAGRPVRVLESFRHRPDDLAELLSDCGLEVVETAISPSGEEGVAVAIRRGLG